MAVVQNRIVKAMARARDEAECDKQPTYRDQMNFLVKPMPKISGDRCLSLPGSAETLAEAAFGASGPVDSLHPLVKLRRR